MADTRAMLEQTNKLHRFTGDSEPYWLFEGGQVRKTKPDLYAVEYSWLGERGNFAIPQPANLPSGAQIAPIPARKPHENYEVVWGIVVPFVNERPTVVTRQPYEVSLNGIMLLAGDPGSALPPPGIDIGQNQGVNFGIY
jgi:hypothetical protein